MDRRAVSGILFGTMLAGGIAAMIGATALPTGSPYFDTLIVLGAAGIVIGIGGLLWLGIFPVKPKRQTPRPVVDQSVTSHGQTGGLTAHTVNVGDDQG